MDVPGPRQSSRMRQDAARPEELLGAEARPRGVIDWAEPGLLHNYPGRPPITLGMGRFHVGDLKVPHWRGSDRPDRHMGRQVGALVTIFDRQKDMRSIGALMQGIRWIDETHSQDASVDATEWQAVSRAMRKALGNGTHAKVEGRAERIEKAFAEEAAAGARR